MNKNITIIIKSFNRPKYLLRALKFIFLYDKSIPIIILDSSSIDFNNKELENILKNKNIRFLKFPSDIFMVQKIYKGSMHIDTEYCVLCPDDDLILVNSLLECINFLKKNTEYSSVQGHHFHHPSYEEVKKDGFNFYKLYEGGLSAEENDKFARIKKFLSGNTRYYPFYGVHRTSNFKIIWDITSRCVDDWALSEYVPSILSLSTGKMKILPIVYMSRERHKTIFNLFNNLSYLSKKRVIKASNEISNYINTTDQIPIEHSLKILIKHFKEIRKKYYYKYYVIKINEIISFIPKFIRVFLKKFFKIKNFYNDKRYSYKISNENYNEKDINNIKSIIITSQIPKKYLETNDSFRNLPNKVFNSKSKASLFK